ncbi:MAG: leucine-rich repeat protein [Bacteroidaceae bacterium]|nr:leucine-rich repeat protein [Bacteroidaceae bacterium]
MAIRIRSFKDCALFTFEKNGIETIQEVEIKNEDELHDAVKNADRNTLVAVEIWCQEITSIGQTTFQALPQLRSIDLPSSVKEIYPNAFRNCHNLQEVNLRGDVQRIEVRFGCYAKQTLDKPFNGLAGLLQTGAAASIDPDDSWSHWD